MKPLKWVRYVIEFLLVVVLRTFLYLLPIDVASALGGFVARKIGPLTKVHKVAQHNLKTVMPELDDEARNETLNAMWDNFGRVFSEYPHLSSAKMRSRVHFAQGEGVMREHTKDHSGATIFISGHLANWEVTPLAVHYVSDSLHLLYRPANNPLVEWFLSSARDFYSKDVHTKGPAGARAIVRAIKSGEDVGILVDQKTNDGIEVNFFGHPAMTTAIVAQIALKYDVRVIPCYSVRKGGVHFDVFTEAPLVFQATGDYQTDVVALTQQINDTIEGWIRKNPSQWFWVHKRWPFSKAVK
ncbi:MAG: hypothetical protein MRY32_09720 [Rickettsiales bacterium]|nr:hypothetical protein [Rickettsiales bacterium]